MGFLKTGMGSCWTDIVSDIWRSLVGIVMTAVVAVGIGILLVSYWPSPWAISFSVIVLAGLGYMWKGMME